MELAFESKPLRTICESEARAKEVLGQRVAEELRHRLADIRAAMSTNDLVVLGLRELDGTKPHGPMVMDLCDGYRIVIAANHRRTPMTEIGRLDWPRVSRVKILEIGRPDA